MFELSIVYIICISFILYLSRGLTWKEFISFLDIRNFDESAANKIGTNEYKKRKRIGLIILYISFFIPFLSFLYFDSIVDRW